MFTMSEIIEFAIRIEENGEKVYRDASEKVSDPYLVSFLKWLADEEAEHVQWFSDLKRTVRDESVDPQLGKWADFTPGGSGGPELFAERKRSHYDSRFKRSLEDCTGF